MEGFRLIDDLREASGGEGRKPRFTLIVKGGNLIKYKINRYEVCVYEPNAP